ncbi:ATP-binding cassette domain-containing protein [Agromyces seonyuensis]|uniref:ATP-binding cassette domain-containing protein n=1 Tax=Agromyces seonyuensis TaxID=2662446 RepID=A0A6I4NYA4_9MICO|nr:ATP-binding cassette domain-containing protein [Agromyces seonyuensis]MWB99296.1 ATP-binding cassette domain-containing protein [Agromyces seonyuensis]
MSPIIDVRALAKRYGRTVVLDGLSFTVEPGEIFGLLGPNGAGKTTTIEILTTLVRPDGGSATIDGVDVVRGPADVRRRIAVSGQSAAVDARLTGAENLRLLARLSALGRRETERRTTELLERFDLVEAAGRQVGTYSGGMRRRLDLALSLIVPPRVLFLDEPTTGLDPVSRRELWESIRSLADGGTTVLLTTQYLDEADRLADRIAVLDGGRAVALGTPAELKSRVGGTSVQLRDPDGELLAELPTDGSLHGLREAIDELDRRGARGSIALREPTLDDVYDALVGAGRAERPAEPALAEGVAS